MKRVLVVAAFFLLGASVILGVFSTANSSAGPEITQSFASQEIRPGDTWKIYLNASDLSGKMKYIYAVVEQPGGNAYPLSITKIKPENRKELSGYVYLNTLNADKPMDFVSLNLVIHVGDGAGNFSPPAIFPLTFSPRAIQGSPPSGNFKEQDLGALMFHLRPAGDDGQGVGFGN